ncbi:MAG: ferredoxin [Patescibacteria group bacterium]|nr:ferredoxin [Patescibacteria group bacterium]
MSDLPKDPAKPHGPVAVGELSIHVDPDICIGAATCIAIAPNTFLLDSEAKAIILDTADADEENTIIDAARGCPVAAIYIEKNGQRIYPA